MSQWADDSMTPAPISVGKDKFGNEIPTDQPSHEDVTPGKGAFNWSGNHYDDSPGKGGFGSYGVSAADKGQTERTSVNVAKADRGQDA